MADNLNRTQFTKHYNQGYAAGLRGNPDALGKADSRGVPRDWYAGFHHGAAGEPKGGHKD